jgi:hypothetical protein
MSFGRRPPSEWRDHLKQKQHEDPKPVQRHMRYCGSRKELRGRTALVIPGRRSGLVIAQFDFPEHDGPIDVWDEIPHDPLCFGWHPFTEGEFEEIREETPRERRRRQFEERKAADERYESALADFGREVRYYEPLPVDDPGDHDYEMDHLIGLDGWGRD